jgi:hypothetical protein
MPLRTEQTRNDAVQVSSVIQGPAHSEQVGAPYEPRFAPERGKDIPARRWVAVLLIATAVTGIGILSLAWRARTLGTGNLPLHREQNPIAVFGDEHSLNTNSSRARSSTPASRSADASPAATEVPRELAETLRRCMRALSDASCYAPVLESFHHQHNLQRANVVEQRRRLLQLYPRMYKYEISNLRLESGTPDRAIVTFDKEWDMAGERSYAGAAKHRVTAVKTKHQWQIVAEEEQQVYWARRR